jgi:hypothetical protein
VADAPHPWNKTQIAFGIFMGLLTLGIQQCQRYSDQQRADGVQKQHAIDLKEQSDVHRLELQEEKAARLRAEDLTRRAGRRC